MSKKQGRARYPLGNVSQRERGVPREDQSWRKGQTPEDLAKWDLGDMIVAKEGRNEPFDVGMERLFPNDTNDKEDDVHPTWEETRGFHQPPFSPTPIARELPDLRIHLMRRWEPGGVFAQVLGSMEPVTTRAWEYNTLKEASLWWVKDDMVQITMAGMGTIPNDVTPRDVVPPAEQERGLALLETPYIGTDAMHDHMTVQVDAILWGPSVIGGDRAISVSCYHYSDFGKGMGPAEMSRVLQQGSITEGYQIPLGKSRDGNLAFDLRGGAWVFMGKTDWPLDCKVGDFPYLENAPAVEATAIRVKSMEEDRRFFASFAVLVNHRLSEEIDIHPSRQVKRRSERAGVTEPSLVKYIRLREIKKERADDHDGTEHGKREYSHRWFSRGHMAWRWYGPGKKVRHLVYVNPSIKGPQDKPLVVKTEVRTWVR